LGATAVRVIATSDTRFAPKGASDKKASALRRWLFVSSAAWTPGSTPYCWPVADA
jgi:hypothetical protein